MATAQAIRTEEKSGSWASMFPVEQVTEQQSTLFAKKLMAVAISNITYLRAIFPERAYGDRSLGDLNLKILRDDSSCPGASQVIKWVKGCFDALDKKYLRMLIIGIYVDPEDPNTIIESYTFKFSYSTQCGVDVYHNEQKISSMHTTEKTKKETIQLLRTIIVLTQSLQPLPDNVMMTMKLLYYDEITPSDYEPPGFQPSDHDSFRFEEEPLNIKLGDVSTPFHGIKMRIKTDKKQFDIRDNETEETGEEQTISNSGLDKEQEYEQKQENGKQTESAKNPHMMGSSLPCSEKADIPSISPGMPEKNRNTSNAMDTTTSKDREEYTVRCPCGKNEDDGLMIVCEVCNLWQHAVCFCILEEEQAPEEHICDSCAKASAEHKKATDPYLTELSAIGAQATCLWRRALVACTEFTRLLPNQLAVRLGIETTVAQGLMNRLEKEGFIRYQNKGRRLGKVVDKEKLENVGIPSYFKPPKEQPQRESIKESPVKELSTKNDNKKEKDIAQVTEKTACINLNNRQLRITTLAQRESSQTSGRIENSSLSKDWQNKKGRKRAFSKVDESAFDISSSQDCYETRSRKRKSSDVKNAIVV